MTGAERLRQEGRKEGQQRMLLKLLGHRFGKVPEETAARIAQAQPSTLERWAERVLTAASLEEVLEG